jgi:DNA-binding NtrC family response regulator
MKEPMASPSLRPFSLLLVDDEPAILSSLKRVFRKSPYDLHSASNVDVALELLAQIPVDAALVDLKMPGKDGMVLLKEIRQTWPHVRVIILTGHGGVEEAVAAIQMGAVDFLQKPYEDESLKARIGQLYQIWSLEQENQSLKASVQFQFNYNQLIGNSTAILNLKKMILQVAPSDASILIQGETGTGKELVAQAVHAHSPCNDKPFVPVDCAGISESVMGSELFGHVKGAFTGAHESTPGLIRSADGGTLFLDEVGELSLSMQVKLLRTIQEKEVRPVGSSKNYPVNVRILAATNRDLEKEVEEGRFRQDLFYRLNVVVISVPPLRDRLDDVPLLARKFLQEFSTPSCPVQHIAQQTMAYLTNYEWPGNVRELENVIRRAMAIGTQDAIVPGDLPEAITGNTPPPTAATTADEASAPFSDSLASYEKAAITNALAKCDGHRKNAARLLGIGEATLYRKLNKYQIA